MRLCNSCTELNSCSHPKYIHTYIITQFRVIIRDEEVISAMKVVGLGELVQELQK